MSECTYVLAALVHVSSAVVMFRSTAMKLVMTTVMPTMKDDIAIAIVAVSTNRTSCDVDLKQAGLPVGFIVTELAGEPAASASVVVAPWSIFRIEGVV